MKAKIQDDLKTAMKARDELKTLTLRGLVSEIKLIEIDTKGSVSDEKIVSLIQKEIKKRRDALEFAEKAGRTEMIEQNNAEIKILQGYLGEQLSEEKLREIITTLVKSGADNLGKVMGALNKDYKGKFDGKTASEMAKQFFQA